VSWDSQVQTAPQWGNHPASLQITFIQTSKDHFATTKGIDFNRIPPFFQVFLRYKKLIFYGQEWAQKYKDSFVFKTRGTAPDYIDHVPSLPARPLHPFKHADIAADIETRGPNSHFSHCRHPQTNISPQFFESDVQLSTESFIKSPTLSKRYQWQSKLASSQASLSPTLLL
jgi:hypothetical protein